MNLTQKLATEFNLSPTYAANIVNLIEEGNTIPFIARYRKEMHGNCDDQVLREFSDRLTYLKNLEKRKDEIRKSISEQGKMTEELELAIAAAETMTEVEDLYRPYKQKKKTRATMAIAKGLEPLADRMEKQEDRTGDIIEIASAFVGEDKGVSTPEEALAGARDIIAERISDNAALRKKLRNIFLKTGEISSKLIKEGEEAKTYEMYAEYSEPVCEVKSHRVLALNRGEDTGYLRVKVEIDKAFAGRICAASAVKEGSIFTEQVRAAAADSYDRLIAPSMEREIRSYLTEQASEQAIKMFEQFFHVSFKDRYIISDALI